MAKIKANIKKLGSVAKTVGYKLPKAIIRKTFTNANQTDVFGPNFGKKK